MLDPRVGREMFDVLRGATALALALGCVNGSPAEAANRGFDVRAPSAWVRPLAVEAPATAAGESTGARYLLLDEQLRATQLDQEQYSRVVWKIETTAGLQDASEVTIDFSPSFERLSIHHVRVLRSGREAWLFSPDAVRLSQAQDDPDSRLYDDTLTATVFVEGLQVGDTVDYAYSLRGRNPVLAGHFDTRLWFEFSWGVDRVHRSLLWQRAGKPRFRRHGAAPQPSESASDRGTRYEWDTRATAARPDEDGTPSWFEPAARVEVSDFDGWPAVARRARELFASVDEQATALDAVVGPWRALPASERVERAVRFVQDDVRYLGLEMGPHSHQPHRPADTLARRFGDCKDKSALLVALLRLLGAKAWPALVSTEQRQALDDRLPSMFAFDHAIVALEQDGALRFVDATVSQQGGRVADREQPPFLRALVLDDSRPELVRIEQPSPAEPTTIVAETFDLPRWGGAARLDVVTTYRGTDADAIRESEARSTRSETGKRYRDFYARAHDEVRALGVPRFQDDRERNVVVVQESYELPRFSAVEFHDFRAWLVDGKLVRPKALERTTPLGIEHPVHLRQTIVVRLPERPGVEAFRETVTGPAFALDTDCSVRGREARLDYVYRSLGASVEPPAIPTLTHAIDRAAGLTSVRVRARAAAGVASSAPGWFGGAILACGLTATAAWATRALITTRRQRRRRSGFRALVRAYDGDQPGTALVIPSEAAITLAGLHGACGCGGPWFEVDRATALYDGERLHVLTRRCGNCANESTRYLRVGGSPSQPRQAE